MAEPQSAPLTPLQRAFLALEEARARVAMLEGKAREPIAVIGLGLRAPGGAHDAESFWRLLSDGADATGPVPAGRWDHDRYYDPDPDKPGRIATRRGGFLADVDRFDAGFFGISPREADGMDPQQRLLLTVAWEALEHAGQAPTRLEGTRTGVYIGVTGSDYAYLELETGDEGLLDPHFASGIAHSIASGRISYLLGLQGPSLTIDTACSSSLIAIHLAMQALRAGDCRMALAGGVNLILGPDIFVALSRARMLAPDGRCKAFSADADGFARAEGCGVVVLKRLSDAQADGDRILAVLRGSAVNQDGASSSLTAPNGPAQEAVIRLALADAGVAAKDVGLIEAHGTGTELGDPIEVKALGAVFGPGRDAADPVLLGSVKTNIGHAEGAAGVLGVIKAVLAVRNRAVPAHLHCATPSPHIAWDRLALRVPQASETWTPRGGRRIAGVSSFGFSGSNAHVVIEEAPTPDARAVIDRARLLTVSGRSAEALAATAGRLAARLASEPDFVVADAGRTLNAGRSPFDHRATALVRTPAQAVAALTAIAAGETPADVRRGDVMRRDPPRIAFLFTGQGSQYPGMARGLYETCPAFRTALVQCGALLEPHLGVPLTELLFDADRQRLDATQFTQPALFAVEYALAQAWRAWGIVPNVVIGHSVGEYVAATLAGVLTLPDALRLVAARGRLMQSLPAGGGMTAVFAPEARVAEAIAASGLPISIAAVNGPVQTVISGPLPALAALSETLSAQGAKCAPLPVSHGFHSALVDPVLPDFEREAGRTTFAAPQLRLISNVTGRTATAAEMTRPAYWRDHMRQPVRFADGLRALAEAKPDLCIEIGPHPALLSFAGAAFEGAPPPLLPSLRKGRDDLEQMLDSLGQAFLAGASIDWRAVDPDGRVIDLPGQAMSPERHWFKARPGRRTASAKAEPAGLPGARLRLATGGPVFEATLSADRPAYVAEHKVQGRVVMPATAYLAGIADAAGALRPGEPFAIEHVVIGEALLLDEQGGRTVQTVLEPDGDGAFGVRILSLPADASPGSGWTLHVSARLNFAAGASRGAQPTGSPMTLEHARLACPAEEPVLALYAGFAALGLEFGPGFRTLRRVWSGPSEALGEIVLDPATQRSADTAIHPVLLDGCLQVAAAAMSADGRGRLHLPAGIGGVVLNGKLGDRCFSHVRVRESGSVVVHADITIFDADGALAGHVSDLQLQQVDGDALARLGARRLESCLYELAWAPAPAEPARSPLPDPRDLAAAGAAALPALAGMVDIAAHDRASARLEALCVDFAADAMRSLGLPQEPGTLVAEAGLADRLGVVPRHHRLLRRLLGILEEDGRLRREDAGWRVVSNAQSGDPAVQARRLLAEEPLIRAELGMTARVAPHLADALRGRLDEAALLFQGGSTDEAERLYRDSPTARLFNGLMAEIVAAAARTGGRPLRILEVGAGTGGTTAHVLPRLPEDAEYTFTDIGRTFVERARERFGARPAMRFDTLDLERDPSVQGFAPRGYDVVIASNVVHATANIAATLKRLRELMAPGGVLAMLEVTGPQRWFDLTVGLTEGWWAFTDTALRPDYPTLSLAQWLSLLPACGFEAVASLPASPARDGALARQAVLLARMPRRSWLVLEDAAGVLADVIERLRQRGETCLVVRKGAYSLSDHEARLDLASPTEARRLLSDLSVAGRLPDGVIHGWSLDIPANSPGTRTDDSVTDAARSGVLGVMHLAQALLAAGSAPRIWVVTRGGQQVESRDLAPEPLQASVWGLGRSLALEHPELQFTCVDIDQAGIAGLADEVAIDGPDRDVALRGDRRLAARIRRLRPVQPAPMTDAPWRLVVAQPGSIEAFQRAPLERRAPGPGEVEIAVEASGLNFRDVLNALGLYPGDAGPLGAECAGTVLAVGPDVKHVTIGDPVMAAVGGSFASHVLARAELVQRRPDDVGPEEGACFPIAFLTAAFCLDTVARLQPGETVLIHAAAGGVGLAAVRLALRTGATVIATAGSPAKRRLLLDLGVAHAFDSRSSSFAQAVRDVTGGRGVDVVLNSLGGDLVEPSFAAIAEGGRFVEIGKRGIKSPDWVRALGRSIAYTIVDWGETAAREPSLIGDLFARLAADLASGALAPLPRHVFPLDRVADAFRLMAQAGHVGRIVVGHAARSPALARRDGTYLITGGLTGLGLAVARHLAERGAGHLVLLGRREPGPEAQSVLAALREDGVRVTTAALDVSDAEGLATLLTQVRREGPPLRGVVHAAGVLANAAFVQQDEASFERVMAPKMDGVTALDQLTRADPLDWFVAFSSIAGMLGAAGQANHAAAAAALDLFAWRRRALGLPALSIDWGAWSEIGAAADLSQQMAMLGLGSLTPKQGLAAFDHLLRTGAAQAAVMDMDWVRYRAHLGPDAHRGLLADVEARRTVEAGPARPAPAAVANIRAEIDGAAPSRRRRMVEDFVRERLLRALGMDPSRQVHPQTAFGELGLDSLLSVELRNVLGTALGRSFPATLLFDYPTIDTLAGFILAECWGEADAASQPAEAAAPASLVGSVEEMSDDEVDRRLRAKYGVGV